MGIILKDDSIFSVKENSKGEFVFSRTAEYKYDVEGVKRLISNLKNNIKTKTQKVKEFKVSRKEVENVINERYANIREALKAGKEQKKVHNSKKDDLKYLKQLHKEIGKGYETDIEAAEKMLQKDKRDYINQTLTQNKNSLILAETDLEADIQMLKLYEGLLNE